MKFTKSLFIFDFKERHNFGSLNLIRFEFTGLWQSQIEKDIAADLDFYLDQYKEQMSQVPETSLYNIFNHESRQLNNHNAAYQFIIENINKNNENKRSFCILIATLDALKMSEKLIQESNLHQEEHFGFVPKSSDSLICSLNKSITEMKNQIDTKFEQLFLPIFESAAKD